MSKCFGESGKENWSMNHYGYSPEGTPSLKADVWQHFGFKKCEDSVELDKTKAICNMHKMEVRHCGNLPDILAKIIMYIKVV